jgi:hypothetical protein
MRPQKNASLQLRINTIDQAYNGISHTVFYRSPAFGYRDRP